MFAQNFESQFIKSIELFASSAQNLETDTLTEIYNIIQDVYGSLNNQYRKEREATLMNLRNSENWKKYILHLFQILCFMETSQILERIGFEISTTIEKLSNSNKDKLSDEELVTLIAANLYTILSKDFPVKVLGHLARALKSLLQIKFFENSTHIIFHS